MRTSNEIRQSFLDFFASKGHRVQPGISLVPTDPSVFVTNAGVIPFRAIIEGREKPAYRRVATCQRCLRTNDIENVGKFARYHTFFEMLGNFSFGDYYKRESLVWGWEYVTEVLGLPRDRFWGTIYPTDEEALKVWTQDLGLPAERIIRLEDNFWGPVDVPGACGPDSEMYYDLGPEFGCGRADCRPGCDCDRYLEFWNHVFTELLKTSGSPMTNSDGTFEPLAQKNIDTGLGLERLTVIVQGAPSVYETDLFVPIMERVEAILKDETGSPGDRGDWRKRVVADHSRAVSFMIMDGIYPSNEGRGYVLRRVLRRAATFGRLLGIRRAFLQDVVPVVVQVMGPGYPDLVEKAEVIVKAVRQEEERFDVTLDQGMTMLEQMLASAKAKHLSGEAAFRLYDTCGFPLDLTREIAAERGFTVDEAGFDLAMAAQRDRARAHRTQQTSGARALSLPDLPATRFVGYESTEGHATAVALLRAEDGSRVEQAGPGEELQVVLDTTPFYAESGGQIGDTGWLRGPEGNGGLPLRARVLDTQRHDGVILHRVAVDEGTLREGSGVEAVVDAGRRAAITRAHTATHLLHAALRQVLGIHVVQRGSIVEPDRLRFDFAHTGPVTEEELEQIERIANERVLDDIPVVIEQKPLEEARRMGAMALFGEKYGEVVRVVQVPGFSTELCGGIHVSRTGTIGQLKVASEAGIAAGVRRIVAVTGLGALDHVRQVEARLRQAAEALETAPDQLLERIAASREMVSALRRQIAELRRSSAGGAVERLLEQAQEIEGVSLVAAAAESGDADTLRALADTLTQRLRSGAVLLGGATDGRALFVSKVTPDCVDRGVHAGNLVREVARRAGGRGGGQAGFAQAGGDASRLGEALSAAPEILREMLAK
jgi:alanyl-tRNA synthetase